jgi:hypothetical protein
MADDRGRGRRQYRDRRHYRDRRRLLPTPLGCAVGIIALLVLLVILSVLFGGFQLGTKAGGMGPMTGVPPTVSQPRLAQL